MRNRLSLFFLALIGIVSVFSCAKTELSESVSDIGRKVHFVVKSGEVKSYVEYDSGTRKYTPKWNTGDELGLYFTTTSEPSKLDGTLTNVAEDGLKATFEGDVTAPHTEGYFYSFTPASRLACFYTCPQFGFDLGDPISGQYIQHPRRSSFDPLCDLLLAKQCHYSAEGGEVVIDDLYFARMFSVLKVNLNGTAVAGDIVNSLKISANDEVALCGRVAVDPDGESLIRWWVEKAYLWAEYDESEKPVAGTDAIYFLVNPQTLSAGLELTIEGDTDNNSISKTITLQAPMEFRQGNVSVLNLTIRGEDCTPKAKTTFVLQTASGAFEDGARYIFAFKDGVSGEYHFLKSISGAGMTNVIKSALKVTDGTINTVDTNFIFEAVLDKTSGKFQFKNVLNGKYIFNSGSGSGLDTANSGSALWSVEFLSASGTYKIIADRYISFGSSASTAKAYLDYGGSKCKDQVYSKIALSQYCGAISVFKNNFVTPVLDTPVLTEGEIGKNSVEVCWEPVSHASSGYLCQIYNGSDMLEEKTVDASPVSFSGLTAETPYIVKVRANAVEGDVPFAQSEFGILDLTTSLLQVEDVTVSGTYHLSNLLVYSIPKSSTVILGDETGKMLLYSISHNLAVGDLAEVSGGVEKYDGVWEFKNDLSISKISSENPVDHGESLAMSEIAAYATSPSVRYVHCTGNQSGLNITTTGGTYQYVLRLSASSPETDGSAVYSSGYAYGYNSKYSNVDYHALELVKQGVSVSPSSIKLGAQSGSVATISVSAAESWTSNASDDWTLSPSSGTSGSTEVTVTASRDNASASDVSLASIVISGSSSSQTANVTVTQSKSSVSPKTLNSDWMELPATVENSSYVHQTLRIDSGRNYSMCYNKETYSPLWSAYPLHKSHTSGSASSSWAYNPGIEQKYQIGVTKNSYGKTYDASEYSRGHCVPNADRKWNSTANSQTYYVTNQTPQIQNKFNSGIWSTLENGIRAITTNYSDTVYVVTGVAFRKTGGSETIKYLSSTTVTPASLPVPNYFWKALLKVKRSGGAVVGASAVGVWLEHRTYDSSTYIDYTVSVDQIEAWTGLDLFANLPASVQSAAEQNSEWSVFYQYK